MDDQNLGRLVRTLGERCSECNTCLQVRSRDGEQLIDGETISLEEKYKYCPICEIEIDMNDDRSDKRKEWRENYAHHKQQVSAFERDAEERRKSYRRGGRRNS